MNISAGFSLDITGELSQVPFTNPPAKTGDNTVLAVVAALMFSAAAVVVLANKKRAI